MNKVSLGFETEAKYEDICTTILPIGPHISILATTKMKAKPSIGLQFSRR